MERYEFFNIADSKQTQLSSLNLCAQSEGCTDESEYAAILAYIEFTLGNETLKHSRTV